MRPGATLFSSIFYQLYFSSMPVSDCKSTKIDDEEKTSSSVQPPDYDDQLHIRKNRANNVVLRYVSRLTVFAFLAEALRKYK